MTDEYIKVHYLHSNRSFAMHNISINKSFLFKQYSVFICTLHVVPVARMWRHSLINIMYADLTPLTLTNESPSLSSPARKRIPSFQAFFPQLAHCHFSSASVQDYRLKLWTLFTGFKVFWGFLLDTSH